MTIYRFVVHPAEEGLHHLECITDSRLFTQARNLDDALVMARDVVHAMYGIEPEQVQVELVVPPDVAGRPRKRTRRPAKV